MSNPERSDEQAERFEAVTFEVQFAHGPNWFELTRDKPESLEEAREFLKLQRDLNGPDTPMRIARITHITEVFND